MKRTGALILSLGCDFSVTLEPHLKQNLSPRFTLDPHESNRRHKAPPFWMRQNGEANSDAGLLLAQVTRDKIFFRICKYSSGFSDNSWICKLVWDLQNNVCGFNKFYLDL